MTSQPPVDRRPRRAAGLAAALLLPPLLVAAAAAIAAPAENPAASAPAPRGRAFAEVSAEAGLRFVHHKPVYDERLTKIMAWMASIYAGVAAADYDGDGDVDLYLLDSLAGHPNALYRNEGGFRFTEVAAASGLAEVNDRDGVSMDALFADVDNDGDQDLFVAQYGRSRLFVQEGGRFAEVGVKAGLGYVANAAAGLFLDYDRDGRLDLMVGHYYPDVDLWNLPHMKVLQTSFETARNGGPDRLFHNDGGGTFTEVGKKLGMDDPGWTLDLGAGDLDGDGDPDVYVANDFGPDLVWRNDGGGTFTDVTAEATGSDHAAGMNAELGDYDGDGDLDVYVTNITNELMRQGNMLWRNQGGLAFEDVAARTKTADGAWGWGGKFLDFDHDGDLDLFTVNGYVSDGKVDIMRLPNQRLFQGDVSDAARWPDMRGLSLSGYEKNRLFRNDGAEFAEVAGEAGVASLADSRGVALADFDGDGDLDAYVSNCGKAPELYRNEVGAAASWLEVEVVGTASNRDGIGARLTVAAAGKKQVREVDGGNGFSAQSSRVQHFGLGGAERVDELEVRWPSGRRQVFRDLPARTKLVVVE